MTITIILITLAAVFLVISLVMAAKVIYPKRFGVQESYGLEIEAGNIIEPEFLSWVKEEVILQSDYGYSLFGFFFPLTGSRRAVILSHGITYTLYGSVKYMKLFRDLGFNIFIYDNRHHGRSGGKNCTFGYYEKYDLRQVTGWVENRLGPDAVIGTHGESMGAAISLQHAAIDPRVRFVIEDCSFNRLDSQLAYRLKVEFHIPAFPLLQAVELVCRVVTGMSIGRVSPEDAVRGVRAPILFIHGGQDDFIPPVMAEKLYAAKTSGPRMKYIPANARHAQSYWNNRVEYAEVVRKFLSENNLA
jgi:fermentation-respiration switch protein FrsA (DUF1100 family)